MDHLLLLPCHSVWLGGDSLGQNQDEWILAPFQYTGNDHLCFVDHIHRAYQTLSTDENALLVISGGATKPETAVSESQSYFNLAEKLGYAKYADKNTILEEYATDSMENVVFLICRFYEVTGLYPSKITVIGFEFKRGRFLENHLTALNWSNSKYVGNSPDPKSLSAEERTRYFEDLNESEYKHAVRHFKSDWFGLHSPLADKRATRNPHGNKHNYRTSNPGLGAFFAAMDAKMANQEIRQVFSETTRQKSL